MNLTEMATLLAFMIALVSAGFSIGIWVHTRNLSSEVAEKLRTTLAESLRDIKNSMDQTNQTLGRIERDLIHIVARTTSRE